MPNRTVPSVPQLNDPDTAPVTVALDRLDRAGNFAKNGAFLAVQPGMDTAATIALYINTAEAMLAEARAALAAIEPE